MSSRPLAEASQADVRTSPGERARELLDQQAALRERAIAVAEMQHERFDGTGYPHGLAGAQILEGAALLALAESWDVMTTARSYSPGKPEPAALAECPALAGSRFSPDACRVLERLF